MTATSEQIMGGLVTFRDISAAAQGGDCATLKKMIAETDDFSRLVRTGPTHPIVTAPTADVAALLLPFARQRDLLAAIDHALRFMPKRPDIAITLIEQGRPRLGRALRDGHVWIDEWRGGSSALHVAVTSGCNEVLPYLLTLRPNLEVMGRFNTTALGIAVLRGNIQAVKILLAAGADPDAGIATIEENCEGQTIAPLLVDAGGRTTASVGKLLTLLPREVWPKVIAQAAPASVWPHEQVAIAFGVVDTHLAKVLLSSGADPTAAAIGALNNSHEQVLHLAVNPLRLLSRSGFHELVLRPNLLREALESGLDANARDDAGHTLLTVAARRLAYAPSTVRKNLRNSIDILIGTGADRSGRLGRDSPLRAYLEIAYFGRTHILRWLLLRGLRDPLALHHYLGPGRHPSTNVLKVLLHFGLSPRVRDVRGRNPLHLLAANKELPDAREHLELLLRAGADPGQKDKENQTPLDIALRSTGSTIIDALTADHRQREMVAMRNQVVADKMNYKRRTPRL